MIRTVIEHKELVANLVARELKGRYKSSLLGFLWSLLIPLFMALIYVVFLRILAGRAVPIEEIIIGVFAWQFTVQCVQNGMTSITANANMVKKVFFPRLLLPVASTLANLVNFLLTLLVQFAILLLLALVSGTELSWWALAVPLVVAYQAFFNLGIAYLLASCNVYFRDTQHLVGVLLSAWFFMSPAMYNLALVESQATAHPWVLDLYMLNPMAPVITAYRALILADVSFPWSVWSAAGLLWPLFFVLLSYFGFKRAQRNFADML
jgi:ABC-type polysaccharide/polyol phosphate export permease